MSNAFQVDLRGVVDLFSRHLYTSPRVYMRELLQNAVDALTARQALDPDAPAAIRITSDDGALTISDTGIGLTYDEAGELLATIGRSSKRTEDLAAARADFLGQFGIGLLSAFMVAERIEVTSRSARDLDEPPIRWVGHADGTYDVERLDTGDSSTWPQPGSTVHLAPRPDQAHWLEPATVSSLAEDFGALLPVDVAIAVTLDSGERLWHRVTQSELPWRRQSTSPAARDFELTRYCEQSLGFSPLAWFDVDLPAIGLSGVAFVLPTPTSPSVDNTHRVYLKRMLLGSQITDVLPDWAFFVRLVVNVSQLRPTASREGLYEDEILIATRQALGRSVLDWAQATLSEASDTRDTFVKVHHLAIRSLALHDDTMLDLASRVLPFETTDGEVTLEAFFERHGQIRYATTVQDFRRVAPVAAAQGLGVVNGGYVYDSDVLARLADRRADWQIEPLAADDVEHVLEGLPPEEELRYLPFLSVARQALERVDCEPFVRDFSPDELPALLVTDGDIEHQKDLQRTQAEVGGMWADILERFSKPTAKRRLVLNARALAVQALSDGADPEVQAAGARTLYVTARLLAGEPLRAPDAVMMNEALSTLVEKAAHR
jgi:molecular chaperone HtpG